MFKVTGIKLRPATQQTTAKHREGAKYRGGLGLGWRVGFLPYEISLMEEAGEWPSETKQRGHDIEN